MIEDLRDDAGWQRLLAGCRRRLERTGGVVEGNVGLTHPTDAERRTVIGLTGRHRSPSVARLTIPLAEIDDALYDRYGAGLLAVLARLDGPVRNRAAERASEDARRSAAIKDAVRRCPRHVGEPWFQSWLEQVETDGTVTRLIRRDDDEQVAWAAEVLNRLPADGLPLPALAEWATGNTKALSATTLATLVLRAWTLRTATSKPVTRGEQRAAWESAGVIMDDLASQVLVLGLKASEDHVIATWLNDAAAFGIPFRLTLHQLSIDPVTPVADDIYVCENPAVLRVAADELAENCATLICSEGQPSAALHKLLERAHGRIHWRGDFDWTGLRTTTAAIKRYDATPWRMTADDYLDALETGDSEPLKGTPTTSPWDPRLADALSQHHRAVMEERLIHALLEDLHR